jgi:hypothetical protein
MDDFRHENRAGAGYSASWIVHRRQFVLAAEPFRPRDDWACRALDESTWLSHCPELRVSWIDDADGAAWALLGRAVETLEGSALVPARYESWTGRWALAGRGELHMDAAGLLGCFYGQDGGGRVAASSSPALLAQLLAEGKPPAAEPAARGISWFPPPRSRFAEIRRLLPSQVLELDTGRVRPRPLTPAIDRARAYDATLDLFVQSLATTLQQLSAAHEDLWLGLTGGFDSRVILAVARRAGVQVRPFTRISTRMSMADRVLPPKLARASGYDHVFLTGTKRAEGRAELVEEHSAGHVSAEEVEPFVHGAREALSGISIGGHGFSVGGGFGNLRKLPPAVENAADGARRVAKLWGEPVDSSATAGIREWFAWALEHPQRDLDWRDRFYIEQRMGGWLSSKEQVYDMGNVERVPVLNAARNYALLLSLDESRRLRSGVQVELLERLAPDLLRYPLNPPNWKFGPYRRLRERVARR